MEKNMEENNLKGAGKTPGTADQAETPQTPHKRRVRYKGTQDVYKRQYILCSWLYRRFLS